MCFFKISLAGDLGSGKTTVGAILKEKFNAEIVSVGKIQRAMAAEMGMDTLAFNRYQEQHPEFDKILDDKLRAYEKEEGNFIFDSRMAWHFVPSAFSVYMKADPIESAKRVLAAAREDESFSSVEEAAESLKKRRASERERYLKFYGVDITDLTHYDLVVDTTGKTPQEVAEAIENGWKNKEKRQVTDNALG